MKTCRFTYLIFSLSWLVTCLPRRRKGKIIQSFHKLTGEAIAVDTIIQKYEKEHQKFYAEETNNGAELEWPALANKNLTTFCRQYLQHSVPTVSTENAIGDHIRFLLHYEKENTSLRSNIIIVLCKVMRNNYSLSYYITRAPEPKCVYSLKYAHRNKTEVTFTIIFKHCNFEDNPLQNKPHMKRKRVEITGKIHRRTGQPIAKNEYLLEYEMEHQDMFKKGEEDGKNVGWPHDMKYSNLDSYCYQYMGECVPGRQHEGTTGSWNIGKLHYQKLNTNKDINVPTITCLPPNAYKRQYHITRAPEPNCVYALLRKGRSSYNPLVIIFKHCDFQHTTSQQTISEDDSILDDSVIPRLKI